MTHKTSDPEAQPGIGTPHAKELQAKITQLEAEAEKLKAEMQDLMRINKVGNRPAVLFGGGIDPVFQLLG